MILRGHTLQSIETLNARDMGIGVPGLTEVRIVDQDGNPVPAGVSGNIQMLSKVARLLITKKKLVLKRMCTDLGGIAAIMV